MLPKTALITACLAKEYDHLMLDSQLVATYCDKDNKKFTFLFLGKEKHYLVYSFAPPDFLLLKNWPTRSSGFEIWSECAGSRIINIKGSQTNRIIEFHLEKEQDDQSVRQFRVIFELFGALTNVYLLNDSGMILHALRVVKDKRALRPQMKYIEPEPFEQKTIQNRAIIFEAKNRIYELEVKNSDYQLHFIPPLSPGELELAEDCPLVSLFQYLHDTVVAEQQLKQTRRSAIAPFKRELKRQQAVLVQIEKELEKCGDADKFKRWGDILMANPEHKHDKDFIRLHDFYEDCEVDIPLPPGMNLIESATHYYKKAKKLSRAPEILRVRFAVVEKNIAILEKQIKELSGIDDIDKLNEAARRFRRKSLVRSQTGATEDGERSKFYRTFKSSRGEKILVGKSNVGNAVLTFKVARTYDIWLHTQQSPGSHAILEVLDKNQKPSHQSITEAAEAAAYYSNERKSTNVPVIYTERRNVHKMRKGAPGQVTYQNVKSVFVDPRLPGNQFPSNT